ncbi:TonB-dependent receptor [Acinetobacter shaoyimingii]|uniref:TonB-dependent receptor n=1 Tax=Acinetobacter shaoyimingii TaxID=2715164 RepID=A0A6G8RY17_9GAMM|nr:TonB-dependent receptor [Acinetobacter shaoyimingii]QIO06797.1 TonB-dependent receptor [Acinetobacter shaoyimingii]
MQGKKSWTPAHLSLLCLTACICQSLYAQSAESEFESVVLPTLKIEAARTDTSWLETPASVYRIDQKNNQNNLGVNLTETLKGVPGLQINNRENYAQDLQISMRGYGARSTFGVRGIRLYVDGIPATMPDGQGQTSNIDLSSLDHIEVLGGPFSSLYGNSSGGTILTTTKQGQGRDSIEMGYSTGSHNKNRGDIILQGGADKAGEPSYVVSTSYFDTNGYREHSGSDKVLSNAKLTWDLADGSKINWMLNYVDITADDPQGLTRPLWQANPKQQVPYLRQFNVRKDIKQTQTGLTWSKPINDQHQIDAMVYAGNREVTQYQSIPDTAQKNPRHAGGVIDFERNYYGTDWHWTGKNLLPNTRITAGLAFDYMDEDRKGYENYVLENNLPQYGVKSDLRRNENNTLWNLDPYLQASWNMIPTVRLDAGVRYSNVHYESKDHYIVSGNGDDSGKTDYDKVLPSAALSWQIHPSTNLYASYAKGFETPTFTEMAYSANNGMNFNLKPGSSDNYEIGLKTQNLLGDFTVAVFQSNTQDDIVSAGTLDGRATYRNADETLRQGVELSWNKKLWRHLSAQASYSFIDATFDANVEEIRDQNDPDKILAAAIDKGNYIPGVAKNQAFIGLGWLPETGFNAGVDVKYMDKIYVDDINSDTAPDYITVNADVGYVWRNDDWKVRTYARIDNLFDKNYIGSVIVNDGNGRFFEPADGLNWSAGLSVTKAF